MDGRLSPRAIIRYQQSGFKQSIKKATIKPVAIEELAQPISVRFFDLIIFCQNSVQQN
jgi:hypothetical protein